MPQSLHTLGTHLIFATRERKPFLSDAIRPKVHAYLAKALHNLECRSITIGGPADHVHLLFDMTKKLSTAKVIEELKRESSKFVKTLSPETESFYWQGGYGLFGVSPGHFEVVRQYVLNQEEHHKTESFQDEFRRLLLESGLSFDERYLWD